MGKSRGKNTSAYYLGALAEGTGDVQKSRSDLEGRAHAYVFWQIMLVIYPLAIYSLLRDSNFVRWKDFLV